jgi:undecaprenyl diphosphate synthase
MKLNALPRALALIPDGNRRWAKRNRLSFLTGYEMGVKKFIDFSEWCNDYGINNISVWAFSTENLNRPRSEVNALFNIYRKTAKDRGIIERLHENRSRFSIVGDIRLIPKDLAASLHKIEKETSVYKEKVINMLIGYGGKADILYAARKISEYSIETGRAVTDESAFRKYLLSTSIPDIDYVIRTSGEQRLSGFMPWQASYSELYFSDKLWPEFARGDLDKALVEYNRRNRRFGK